MGNYGTERWEKGAFEKDSEARCVRNVLAAAAAERRSERGEGRGGVDEGWWAEGSEEQRNYTGLQIVRELSGLQRSAVCFTSQAHLSA